MQVNLNDEREAIAPLPPLSRGHARAFVKCPNHGVVNWYDYVPYSLSATVDVMTCGCDTKGAPRVSEADFWAQPTSTQEPSRG